MSTSQDSYLQAAEGFLFAVRDEIDQLDLRLDDSLKIAEVFALVSIARALSALVRNQSATTGAGKGGRAKAAASGPANKQANKPADKQANSQSSN